MGTPKYGNTEIAKYSYIHVHIFIYVQKSPNYNILKYVNVVTRNMEICSYANTETLECCTTSCGNMHKHKNYILECGHSEISTYGRPNMQTPKYGKRNNQISKNETSNNEMSKSVKPERGKPRSGRPKNERPGNGKPETQYQNNGNWETRMWHPPTRCGPYSASQVLAPRPRKSHP